MTARAVLVTGATSGIGRCIALGLHARGYRVFATARQPHDVAELQTLGLDGVQMDLDEPASIHTAADIVLSRCGGRLYALFNNAGYGQPGAVEDLSRTALRAQFETNVFGTLELTNHVIPALRAQHAGRILFNSSLLGRVALPYRGAYAASKFALEALADTLRLELHGSGIHVCLIEPGPILSRFRANSYLAFRRYIDAAHSPHRPHYEHVIARLIKPGPAAPFTQPPETLLNPIIHALESPRPRIRYPVTVPSHLFAALRRILPDRLLDAVLRRVGGAGKR